MKKIFFQEEVANMNLQKYRQVQLALESAEERAEIAENSLLKLRSKSRSTMVLRNGRSASVEKLIKGERGTNVNEQTTPMTTAQ